MQMKGITDYFRSSKPLLATGLWLLATAATAADRQTPTATMADLAREAFATRCAACHVGGGALMPALERFKALTPEEIYDALRHGVMQEHAGGLDDGQLRALGEMLGDPAAAAKRPDNGGALACGKRHGAKPTVQDWPGWSLDAANARYLDIPFTRREAASLRLKWAFVFPVTQFWSGAANPVTVADGRLFVAGINKWVYALDPNSGCALWAFQAEGRVRSNVVVEDGVALFADLLSNVYALDAKTGRLLWRQRAETLATGRVSGSVAAADGKLFVPLASIQEGFGVQPALPCCTYNGGLAAYDIKTGKRLWLERMIDQPLRYLGKNSKGANRYGPSGVSIFAAPTVDAARGLVYVATGNQHTEPLVPESDAIVALDIATGAKRWVASLAPRQFGGQDIYHMGCETWADPKQENCPPGNTHKAGDRDFAAPAMLVSRLGRHDTLLAGSKDGMLYALDPASGHVLWETRVGKGGELGGILYGMASAGRYAYAPVVDWEISGKTDGALNAVDLLLGRKVWRTPVPPGSCAGKDSRCIAGLASPPLALGEVLLVGGLDGVLRAYGRDSGAILWQYDAVRAYHGVNGLDGKGGAFGMGGPVAYGNKLYVTSGSDIFNIAMGGNALLAFEWDAPKAAAQRQRLRRKH